jgi:adenylate kinase
MDVIIFGPPGAGKGTQAGQVCAHLNVPHVATGDIFRRHLKEGTELGNLARTYIDQGQLVPDEVVVNIVASRLEEEDASAGVLFDGFPRTVRQAELLDAWLQEHGRSIGAVINLQVPDDVVVGRLSGRRTCIGCGGTYHVEANPPQAAGACDNCGGDVVQRKDDNEPTVRARIETYHRETRPVLAYLQERHSVMNITANAPIAQVEAQIRTGLSAL